MFTNCFEAAAGDDRPSASAAPRIGLRLTLRLEAQRLARRPLQWRQQDFAVRVVIGAGECKSCHRISFPVAWASHRPRFG
jgi:hypothetical protein